MGRCSQGFGVCCLFEYDCDSTTTENGTYFISPGTLSSSNAQCKMMIKKLDDDICQVRIDFEDLTLMEPDGTGSCDDEYVQVEPGTLKVPKLCGNLDGQHVIFSLSAGVPATLSVVLDADTVKTNTLKWRMKVTQFSCDSPTRAPYGCLQYYTGVSGSVSSFNYKNVPNERDDDFPKHISNLNYKICLRQELGYCSVEWSTDDRLKRGLFSLSGDGSGLLNTPVAVADVVIGADHPTTACQKDYVMIPLGGEEVSGDANLKRDRYCGQALGYCDVASTTGCMTKALGAVSTLVLPFTLGVVTDNDESTGVPDTANKGFILNYKQKPC